MKRNFTTQIIFTATLAIVMLASTSELVKAQEYVTTPISISKEKVKRADGKVCYSHIVLEKQTLFSIAKAYDVTLDVLYEYNPTLKETGLKKNSIILIPAKEALNSVQESTPAQVAEPVQESKETVIETTTDTHKKQKQRTHVRKWYEDLGIIAEKYGVSVEAIMEANNLTSTKLENRQKLIIPDKDERVQTGKKENLTAAIDSTQTENLTERTDTTDDSDKWGQWLFHSKKKDAVNMTVILPLKAGEENLSRNNMDFYSGLLLAVKDLAEDGISTELNIYDSTDPNHPVTIDDLEKSDIIVGPVSSGDLKRMMSGMTLTSTVISPLDQKAESLAYVHQNFIQVPAPHRAQYEDLASWIKEDLAENDKVFVFSEKGSRETEATLLMKEVIDSSHIDYTAFTYNILEGRDITEPLIEMMSSEGMNRVFIASESEAFVNDVVRNLNILVYRKVGITLYAPARIRNFETIEVENLHNTNAHISLAYNIDYDSPEVQDFIKKYRGLFMAEPSQFAFQGYDTAKYFISLCNKYGEGWSKMISTSAKEMMQSSFKFHKTVDGGHINQGVRRLVYGNKWTIYNPQN